MGQSYNIYWQKPLRQVSVPQHCVDEVQPPPWPMQLTPLPHTPPLQVSEEQHWLELVQAAPAPLQPLAPVHTPPEQVDVPQHWLELVQAVPLPWQLPPEQTLLALQVSTPQQSALEPQRWLRFWQGPVIFGSYAGSESPPPQARDSAMGAARSARRSQVEGRVIGLVYLRFRVRARPS
jgi:hypothetical protein